MVQVCILKHNVGTLAAQLQGDPLQVAGAGRLLYEVSNLPATQARAEVPELLLLPLQLETLSKIK